MFEPRIIDKESGDGFTELSPFVTVQPDDNRAISTSRGRPAAGATTSYNPANQDLLGRPRL
jgi:hypothetical protein